MDNGLTYLITNFTISDPEKFQDYGMRFRETIKPLMENGTARMIVFTSEDTLGVKEGSPAKKIVIIEFKNREIAETWYHSEEYQAIIDMRLDSTKDGWLTITDQFLPTPAN